MSIGECIIKTAKTIFGLRSLLKNPTDSSTQDNATNVSLSVRSRKHYVGANIVRPLLGHFAKLEFIGALHRNAKCKGQNAKLEFIGMVSGTDCRARRRRPLAVFCAPLPCPLEFIAARHLSRRGDPVWSPVTSPILRWLGYTTNSPINQHIQGFVHPLIVVQIATIAIPATACRGRHALHCCGASPRQTQIYRCVWLPCDVAVDCKAGAVQCLCCVPL